MIPAPAAAIVQSWAWADVIARSPSASGLPSGRRAIDAPGPISSRKSRSLRMRGDSSPSSLATATATAGDEPGRIALIRRSR